MKLVKKSCADYKQSIHSGYFLHITLHISLILPEKLDTTLSFSLLPFELKEFSLVTCQTAGKSEFFLEQTGFLFLSGIKSNKLSYEAIVIFSYQ